MKVSKYSQVVVIVHKHSDVVEHVHKDLNVLMCQLWNESVIFIQ